MDDWLKMRTFGIVMIMISSPVKDGLDLMLDERNLLYSCREKEEVDFDLMFCGKRGGKVRLCCLFMFWGKKGKITRFFSTYIMRWWLPKDYTIVAPLVVAECSYVHAAIWKNLREREMMVSSSRISWHVLYLWLFIPNDINHHRCTTTSSTIMSWMITIISIVRSQSQESFMSFHHVFTWNSLVTELIPLHITMLLSIITMFDPLQERISNESTIVMLRMMMKRMIKKTKFLLFSKNFRLAEWIS